jgi:hypothetical protein
MLINVCIRLGTWEVMEEKRKRKKGSEPYPALRYSLRRLIPYFFTSPSHPFRRRVLHWALFVVIALRLTDLLAASFIHSLSC